jgi:hypothetical protein
MAQTPDIRTLPVLIGGEIRGARDAGPVAAVG